MKGTLCVMQRDRKGLDGFEQQEEDLFRDGEGASHLQAFWFYLCSTGKLGNVLSGWWRYFCDYNCNLTQFG